jgi:cardiolipin synthase
LNITVITEVGLLDWALHGSILGEYWHLIVGALTLGTSMLASGHALLHKRDSRAAVSWVGFIWLVPILGAALYLLLGINRIKRRAILLRAGRTTFQAAPAVPVCPTEELATQLPAGFQHLAPLGRIVESVVGRPLLSGNHVSPLINGDEAYPAMLEAIGQAKGTISLSTYIFDRDRVGLAFAEALATARRRGVEVRVLIDAAGTRYSWPSILGELRRLELNHARFLPMLPLRQLVAVNLRTHRKILVVDGQVGFIGGMNLRAGHVLKDAPRAPVQDLHFRVTGPVVSQLQEIFADDWLFTTGEELRGDGWFPRLAPTGTVLARGIPDGPDEEVDKLPWTLHGALGVARSSVRIMTPYFLPDASMISALSLAAMRGVQVDILLPAKNNLPFVHWASRALWWQILGRGCRIWLTPAPFDHSKLMVVDQAWVLFGSANWDPRSLRLNFECNLECYDAALAESLNCYIDRKMATARPVSLAEVDARGLLERLRDGTARLFTPYL